jgi:hypothetical protein
MSILVVIDVTILNYLPHVPHLELYPHHRSPLDVVGLGEGRPPAVGTDVPDHGLDLMVTMVPVRGGRAMPLVKAAISINPVIGASAHVWAAAAVEDMAVVRAPARSTTDASAPVRAAATVPLGVRGCPLRHLLPRCLPRQLELVVSIVVDRNRAVGATGAQSLELCHRRTRCIRRRCCFYFCPCCCQFCHRQSCCPCRRHCSLCRRSLAFLYCGNLGLLLVLCAQGDRALRLSFGQGMLVGGLLRGKRLSQTSCCLSVQERRDDQG